MDKSERKQYLANLKLVIKELIESSNKLPYEDRFDVASLKNNIYNVKISHDVEYIYRYYDTYPGRKLINNFEYIVNSKESSYIKEHYSSVEELKEGIIDLVKKVYIEDVNKEYKDKWVKKHLKPVIAYEKINIITMFKKENRNKETIKMVLLGNQERKGVLPAILIYSLLILFGFIFVYPLLYMLTDSFMSVNDLLDSNVHYLPTALEWKNYFEAWKVLNYPKSLGQTLLISILPAMCQTIVCALTGWGIARYEFKGRKVLFALIIFTFILPNCLIALPTVELYTRLKMTGTIFAYLLPALFGQGFKSAVFILIFYQYFKSIPKTIIEAAEIDGANTFTVFFKIGIPSALSAVLLTFLLSVVWYYNETVLARIYFGSVFNTLPLGLESFETAFNELHQGESASKVNEAIYMAGTILNILPLIVLYAFTQRFFIQGMDKAGITGE